MKVARTKLMAEKAPLVRTRLALQGITAVDETIAEELQAQGGDVDRTVELLAARVEAADVQKEADDGVACHFYFLRSSDILAFAGKSLPAFQTIMADHPGWIVRQRCTFEDALLGTYKSSRLAVSQYAPSPLTRVALRAPADLTVQPRVPRSRWETPGDPDTKGAQLAAVKVHLQEHKDIELVWFDFTSMPQGQNKTDSQKHEFGTMLKNVNLLYLGCSVLAIVESHVQSAVFLSCHSSPLSSAAARRTGPASSGNDYCPSLLSWSH